jgi:HAD superfamily hydrolase (TIGR01484 family)
LPFAIAEATFKVSVLPADKKDRPMMIKLLSTDFDGTLVNHDARPPVAPGLFDCFAELRRHGVLWAVNTGRALEHIVEGLEEFKFPFAPDYVLTTERHVFRPSGNGLGWDDFGDWNLRCERAHQELFATARPLLESIATFVESRTRGQMIYEDGLPAGLIAGSDAEMDSVVEFIEETRGAGHPAFHYQRNTLYLRFCHMDYSKGAALGELGRLLDISRDEIFATGDHFNDIEMLDGRFAKWVACPGNSTELVKETVRKAGGHVARGICGAGVVESLDYFFSGQGVAAADGTEGLSFKSLK